MNRPYYKLLERRISMKRISSILLFVSLLLCACSSGTNPTTDSTSPTTVSPSELFTEQAVPSDYVEIALKGDSATCTARGVELSQGIVTITTSGNYRLSGSFSGMVIVDATSKDDVTLLLSNADITSETSAALYVKQADSVSVILEGENRLTNGGTFTPIDDTNIDAALFSKDPLILSGTGSVTVASSAGHGIVCKDELTITGGCYTIAAMRHGFAVNNRIAVQDGNFYINAEKDGFHAENPDANGSDSVYLVGGTYTLNATGDGISAGTDLQIDGGDYTITTGGGSANAPVHVEQFGGAFPGSGSAQEDTGSAKGLKAKGNLTVSDGNFALDCADDAIHCDGNALLGGGQWQIASGDDAIHAGEQLRIDKGNYLISKCYEGLEGHRIDINGGEIDLTASDDGMNAAGGNDGSGMGGFGGNDIFANDTEAYIKITGGILYLNAGGDGIDSNGSVFVSGGETYLSGPTNSGNGSLDYGGEATVSGGIFVAAGSAGMAAGFGYNSTQGALLVSYNTQPAGSEVILTNETGEELFRWTTLKTSSSLVLSCPGLVQGQTYHLTVGEIEGDITMTDIIYGYSSGMAGGPGGGGPGGGNPPSGGGNPPGGGGGRPPR